jgi:hypothetical protein
MPGTTRRNKMSGIWRFNSKTPEGKYLVTRRDGTVPEWPNMVFGAKDPAAPARSERMPTKARRLVMTPCSYQTFAEWLTSLKSTAQRTGAAIQTPRRTAKTTQKPWKK